MVTSDEYNRTKLQSLCNNKTVLSHTLKQKWVINNSASEHHDTLKYHTAEESTGNHYLFVQWTMMHFDFIFFCIDWTISNDNR